MVVCIACFYVLLLVLIGNERERGGERGREEEGGGR